MVSIVRAFRFGMVTVLLAGRNRGRDATDENGRRDLQIHREAVTNHWRLASSVYTGQQCRGAFSPRSFAAVAVKAPRLLTKGTRHRNQPLAAGVLKLANDSRGQERTILPRRSGRYDRLTRNSTEK